MKKKVQEIRDQKTLKKERKRIKYHNGFLGEQMPSLQGQFLTRGVNQPQKADTPTS